MDEPLADLLCPLLVRLRDTESGDTPRRRWQPPKLLLESCKERYCILFKCFFWGLLADHLLIVSFVTLLHPRLQGSCSGVFQQHVSRGFPCWRGSPACCSVSRRPETCLGASAQPGGEREPQSSAAFRDHAGTHQLAAERRGEHPNSFHLVHCCALMFEFCSVHQPVIKSTGVAAIYPFPVVAICVWGFQQQSERITSKLCEVISAWAVSTNTIFPLSRRNCVLHAKLVVTARVALPVIYVNAAVSQSAAAHLVLRAQFKLSLYVNATALCF